MYNIWRGSNPDNPPEPIQGFENHFEVQVDSRNPGWYLFVRKDSGSSFKVYKAVLSEPKHGMSRPASWISLDTSIHWFNGPTSKSVSKFIRDIHGS